MTTANLPAFPYSYADESVDTIYSGLTKREYFAGLAMQSLLANHVTASLASAVAQEEDRDLQDVIAESACVYADALLAALSRKDGDA